MPRSDLDDGFPVSLVGLAPPEPAGFAVVRNGPRPGRAVRLIAVPAALVS